MGALVTTNDNIVINSGKAYIAKLDDQGNPISERFIGIANDIKASIGVDTAELEDFTLSDRPIAVRRTVKTDFKLTFTAFEKTIENMMHFFQGENRVISQAARTNQTKDLTVEEFDRWYLLEDFYLKYAELVSVQDANDVDISTDAYIFDSEGSRIKFIENEGVSAGDVITVTYNVPEREIQVIEPLIKTDEPFFFRFTPDVNVQGPRYELVIPRCIFNPSGDYGMIDTEIAGLSFEMSALPYTSESLPGISKYAKIFVLDRA